MQLLFYFLRRKRSFKETAKARYFFILQPYFADPNRKRGREPANLFDADGRSLKNMNFSKYAPSSKQNQLQQSFTTGLCSLSGRRQWQVRCWCWRLCLELFGNSFLNVMMSPHRVIVSFFCLIAPRRFACEVYAKFAFYRHCLHVRQSLENIRKQKKAIHWTHSFPFFKMPKKKHHVASCCCATTIKECLFTWDFETKNLMQSE